MQAPQSSSSRRRPEDEQQQQQQQQQHQHQRQQPGISGGVIPAWVARLSRPTTASPRQDSFCQQYETVPLSHSSGSRGHTLHSARGKAVPHVPHLASTQLALPIDFHAPASARGGRSSHFLCKPYKQQPSQADGPDRLLRVPVPAPGKDASCLSARTAVGCPAATRPATAPHAYGQAGQSFRASSRQGPQNALPTAWNLEAIRQQLARLQATSCSPRSHRYPPGSAPHTASSNFRIPAHPGRQSHPDADALPLRRGLSSLSDQSNDENVLQLAQQMEPPVMQKRRQDHSQQDHLQRQQQQQQCSCPPARARLTPRQPFQARSQPRPVSGKALQSGIVASNTALPGLTARPPRSPPTAATRGDRWSAEPLLQQEYRPAGPAQPQEAPVPPPRNIDSASTSSGEDTCTGASTRPPSLPRVTASHSQLCTEPAQAQRPLPEALGINPPTAIALETARAARHPVHGQKPGTPSTDGQEAGSEDLIPWSHAVPGYDVKHVIGVGGFCKVRLGVEQSTGRQVALKIVEKSQAVQAERNLSWKVGREIGIVRQLDHPRINKLLGVVDTPDRMFIILQHLPGGSLLDRVRTCKRLPEPEAARLLAQAAEGLLFCHQHQCVHRDIKLENLLLDEDGAIQLIDFGLAAVWTPGKLLRMHCGSPSYAAPEIVARRMYEGPPVDVWSLGVVLFAMLSGRLPFAAPKTNKQELCAKIMRGAYTVPDHVSFEARDLLSAMLTLEPAQRITLPQLLKHPWVLDAPQRRSQPLNVGSARKCATVG